MPELPEVETVCRGLNKLLPGRSILRIDILNPGSMPNWQGLVSQNRLLGKKVLAVHRRAKLVIIDLENDQTLLIHLKMTGQLVFVSLQDGSRFGAGHPNNSLVDTLPDRSTRIIFHFDGGNLYFNDQRKFGWIQFMPTTELASVPFLVKAGPEPLDEDFSAEAFENRIRRRPNSVIKAVLLDQSIIAGIGNIYADESLWHAMIHPETRVRNLATKQLNALYNGVRESMNLSIRLGGSTDRNYVDAEGRRGAYLEFAAVFRRQGQACRRCGNKLVKTRVAGRGSHWCPVCQVAVPTT